MKQQFLIESALLTHGLTSVSARELLSAWPFTEKNIVWIDSGHTVIGDIEEFSAFRARSESLIRIDGHCIQKAVGQSLSGALTASGTMSVCESLNIKLAVTCGMGGIGDIETEKFCADLPALAELPVTLIATSPKDMLDIPATLGWLKSRDVRIIGAGSCECTGYIFNSARVQIESMPTDKILLENPAKRLILQGIPSKDRIDDLSILQKGVQSGKSAEKMGEYYHPAVNKQIDVLTKGHSSRLQLKSLIDNVRLAKLVAKC